MRQHQNGPFCEWLCFEPAPSTNIITGCFGDFRRTPKKEGKYEKTKTNSTQTADKSWHIQNCGKYFGMLSGTGPAGQYFWKPQK